MSAEATHEQARRTEAVRKPRFVLIDHSVVGDGGHYLEYARHVLTAAERAGHAPILVTNRAFEQADLPWPIYRVYERDIWGRKFAVRQAAGLPGRTLSAGRQRLFEVQARLWYSRLSLLWLAAGRRGGSRSSTASERIAYFGLSIVPFLALHAPLAVARCALLATTRSAPRSIRVGPAKLAHALRAAVSGSKHRGGLIVDWYRSQRSASAFSRGTVLVVRALRLQPDEHVFVPTLSEADFVGLLQTFREQPLARLPSWHVLFRRPIEAGHESRAPSARNTWRDQARRELLRRALLAGARGAWSGKIHCYTDTDRLAEQFRRLSATEFVTLPIPVNPRFQQHKVRAEKRSLEIVFLGDAREEKGYQHLPLLVGALWQELEARKVHFTIQSNFAFTSSRSDPLVVVARNALRSYPAQAVQLREHALTSGEYEELLLCADIVVAPYAFDRYRARSSGVLAEALSAGVPIVVPAGTWMGDEVQAEDVAYHDQLLLSAEIARPTEQSRTLRDSKTQMTIRVHPSPRDTHVLVRLTFASHIPRDAYVDIRLADSEANALQMNRARATLGPGPGGRATALFELFSEAREVHVSMSSAGDDPTTPLPEIELYCLALAHRDARTTLAIGAVGRTYARVDDLPDIVREVVAHHPMYLWRANDFAKRWTAHHNPDRLVAAVTSRSNVVGRPSRQGSVS